MIFLPIGAVFTAVGFIDFFGAFAGGGFPTKFWCAFVGLPMLAFGTFCFKAGFLRTITGYVAEEAAPAIRDTAACIADGLKPSPHSTADNSHRARHENEPAERMRNLEELKKQGMISDSEYMSKRQEILEEI